MCGGRRIDRGLAAGGGDFELFYVTLRNDARITLLQFAFDVQFLGGLPVGALGFLNLRVCFQDIRLRRHHEHRREFFVDSTSCRNRHVW